MNVGQRGINSKDLGAGRLILDLFHDVALYFWESVIVERSDDLRNAADRFFFRNVHVTMHYHVICHYFLGFFCFNVHTIFHRSCSQYVPHSKYVVVLFKVFRS